MSEKVDTRIAEGLASQVKVMWQAGALDGRAVQRSRKTLGEIRGLFAQTDLAGQSADTEAYSVEWFAGGGMGVEGGLLFGCTHLLPGKVGNEYFMTHGHFHALPTRAEIYLPVSGRGLLLRMERNGNTWTEEMSPGGLLYIDGLHAHRVVNTGSEPLVFWACWPSDAGYDYASIAKDGFGLRVIERDGQPVAVKAI